jgi:5'(3')-deoxyribonucleotidase
MNNRRNTIYIDMDGVVADFDTAATDYLRNEIKVDIANKEEGKWPPNIWERLRDHHRFYRYLPKMECADRVIELAREFRDDLGWNLMFLTAIPRGNDMPWTFYDKVMWAQERYPDIPVHFGPYSHDKQSHCHPGDILVDDRKDNCEQWRSAGGVAVKIDTWEVWHGVWNLEKLLEAQKGREAPKNQI